MITTDTGEAYENEFHHAIDSPLPEVQLASMINPENDPFHGKPDAGGAAGPLSRPIPKVESVDRAAVQSRAGDIHVDQIGSSHTDILKQIPDKMEQAWSKDGFITNEGRFIDRYEAQRVGVASGQLDPKTTNMNKGAISEDFPHINKARWEKTINHLEEMKQHTDRWDDLMLPGDKEDFLGHLKDYVKDKFK